jgi:hypothetical protein
VSADRVAPDWIPFQPARWIAGTSELDGMTEFVFFRLVVHAYEAGNPLVPGSDRRNALRCKVDLETFQNAIELLVEFGKVKRVPDGIFVPSTDSRISDANGRIAARRRGASIARRRGTLKAEGKTQDEINLIIRREFPDDQEQKAVQTPHNTEQDITEQDITDTRGGAGGDFLFSESETGPDPVKLAVDDWNAFANRNNLAKVQVISEVRRKKLVARLKDAGGIDGWRAALDLAGKSVFLLGKSAKSDWKMDFDFLLQQSSFIKLMEGSYQGGTKPNGAPSSTMSEIRGIRDHA